uniref:SH3 domain-containing protein n=1 Tax=Angiostrongylus cantonensis TaxID=6313 RepID=A0A158PBP5_ANGCA
LFDLMTPSYYVEHLATFAVGRQFGLTFPADGIRKLKQMEKNSAIWAQPLVLRLRQSSVTVEDENGDLVEQFPLDLIEQPTAHVSNDPRDTYNNILLFIVREDARNKRSATPTEMHIFQCNRVAATEVADDLQWYIRGQFRKVRNGRRSSGPAYSHRLPPDFLQYPTDDSSLHGDTSELFERDVNTLNRCFDDIERFVARIQSAAFAQRELEQQAHRYRTAQRRDKRGGAPPPDPNGILQMRAQLPIEPEFVDIFRKFKLSFNLLAKLKNHIHEPNAPELLHFLFTPLTVILEACHWGLGRNIAPQIVSPLLSLEARELMQNCLTSKESDVWMSLGETWRTPPEDWRGPLPQPYRPVFVDGFAPYGLPEQQRLPPSAYPVPLHRGESAPPAHYRPSPRDRSVDTLDLDRLSLERERLDFEKQKMLERERRLQDEEKMINQPVAYPVKILLIFFILSLFYYCLFRAFVEDAIGRGSKLVMATFDRVAQNAKELTVSRGEYLEVLDDAKNWWECRNVHQRVGYVPHTILSMVSLDHPDSTEIYVSVLDTETPPMAESLSEQRSKPKKERSLSADHSPHVFYVIFQSVKPRYTSTETHALMTELNETFGKKAGQALRKAVSRTPTVSITENSTPEEVSLWLQKKGFSPRVTEILEGQDGANLFALNKNSLIQACGREEGTRLYSQLLVQKRQSNYRTHSSAELNAILNYRRMHVEVTNEAPANEPATIVGE